MGDKTQLERIMELEATVRVLTEEVARLRADLRVQQAELLGGKKKRA